MKRVWKSSNWRFF